ncbi:MAG: polysaccharide biosynthesis tyrosine autokinase [Ruminococcus sp.]|nr:polysaccharide biosynthesis tyrosine autokinase [Ruminococcus sp.]
MRKEYDTVGTLNQKNKNKQDDETEIDLGKLFKALMRRLPIILLVTLCFSAIGFSYGKYYLPLEYTSSTYMYVKNGDASEEKTAINQQDLMASKSLVETYIVILKNDTVVKQVGMSLVSKFGVSEISKCFTVKNGVISTSELKDAISMSADGDTEVLKISAQTKDPHVSAEICDIYAEVAPTFLIRIIGAGSVEVIGDAEVPQSPSAPDVKKITMMAAAAGFVLSAGVAVLIYLLDRTIKGEDDIQSFSISYLGEVPEMVEARSGKRKRRKKKNSPSALRNMLLCAKDIPFPCSEAYRSIRTNLMFALAPQEHKIVAVTSPNAADGKSLTAANIAMAMAMMNKKVLFIDADLRKPVQHQRLKLENKVGLSEVLGHMTTWQVARHLAPLPNMDVLTAGTCPPNPSELLASPAMKKLLEEAEQQYDYIIIDTPPVNVVSDALGLSDCIGGILMVARYYVTTTKELETALQAISVTGATVLGLVLTEVDFKQGGYYKKYYKKGSYYTYGNGSKKKSHSHSTQQSEPVSTTDTDSDKQPVS